MSMLTEDQEGQEWLTRGERGTVPAMKAMVWLALSLGRPLSRLLLYPITLYFVLAAGEARRSSARYLARVLGRPARRMELFRHFFTFAAVILDRVYLLNDRIDLFDIRIEGEELVKAVVERGEGCLLLGAHLGSFEVLRAIGRRQPNLAVSIAMYEQNARKIGTALNAINPALVMDVVALGQPGSMLTVGQRLGQGHFVGVLADRSPHLDGLKRYPFLGTPAAFPDGPFRMAEMFGRTVVLMSGLYRGRNRYDITFEILHDPERGARPDTGRMQAAYVERLQEFCRDAPFNWFNFYDFWK